MKSETGSPEKKTLQIRDLLRKLLKADDLLKAQRADGELSRVESAKLRGKVTLSIDKIAAEALEDEELAEAIAPALREGAKRGNPLCAHFLIVLGLMHKFEKSEGTNAVAREARAIVREVEEKNGLADVEKEWADRRKEAKKRKERPVQKDNQMYA